jgi:PAS domain S-box-containing protein
MSSKATKWRVGSEESPPTVDLGIAGWHVPLHSHIACLCETEEHLDEALGFVIAGLRGSDHCVIIGDAADLRRILGSLERQGVDVAAYQASGRLRRVVRGSSARATLEEVTAAFAAGLAAGADVLRLSGIVGWDREHQAPDGELFATEALLADLAEKWPLVILCLHQVQSMSGETLLHGALETHPELLAPGGVLVNPYYVALNRAPERLAALGAELSRRQQERVALRHRSELLQTIFDYIPVMVSLFDPAARRQIFANREWERVTGWTLEESQRVDILAELYPDPADLQRANQVIREGAREWTAFKTRARGGRIISTLWMRTRLSDGTTIGFGLDVTERKQTEERLQQSYEELRGLSAQLRSAREEESTRIAREVHDEIGQMLTALRLDVAWLDRQLESPSLPVREPLVGKLHDMSQLLNLASDAVHRISSELRPGILDMLGLEAAVEWYVEEFEKRTGISCRRSSTMAGADLSSDQATALFRILQEALTNVARHAGATAVDIRLTAEPGRVTLDVVDNGSGIPEHKIGDSRSIGLVGMRERARALGGDLVVRSNPAPGTTVEVVLPL